MTDTGRLIVLEGPDGVGKSTLTAALADALAERGFSCSTLAFPGKEAGSLGDLIYRIHHDPHTLGIEALTPAALQISHVAAHADAIERHIKPAITEGLWVILDRYWWSTWVYGRLSGIDDSTLAAMIALERTFWGAVEPKPAILIHRKLPWRESEVGSFWEACAREYDLLARAEATRHAVVRIENNGPINAVLGQLLPSILGPERDMGGPPASPFELRRAKAARCGTEQLALARPLSRPSLQPTRQPRQTLTPLRSTEVYETYWRFAAERQDIFFRKLRDSTQPLTADPILQRFKFTNAYRASDRVSQYLIRHVIYDGDQAAPELFFRVLLFKLFNRIETWELLKRTFGELRSDAFDVDRYDAVLEQSLRAGDRIYSAAYIMPTVRSMTGPWKHSGHLKLLERMMRDDLPHRLQQAPSLRHAFELLQTYPMMGDFLAYQYIIDLNYSTLLNFSEMEFIIPGPGALSGIQKCFSHLDGLSAADVIRVITESQETECAIRGIQFHDLWGRPLQLIDCQNLFCEVDKYARVAHPEVKAGSGRERIKQAYRARPQLPTPWYPPKWGLNERIARESEGSHASA